MEPSGFFKYYYPYNPTFTNKDFQYIFTDYGSIDSINLEYDNIKEEFRFEPKHHKPLLIKDSADKNCVFVPSQPALPLGAPNTICKMISHPTEEDIYIKRFMEGLSNRKLKDYFHLETHLTNLVADHPDLAHGTYLRLLSEYFPTIYNARDLSNQQIISGHYWPKQFDCDPKNPLGEMIPTKCRKLTPFIPWEVNPYFLDVPLPLLNKLLLEELKHQDTKAQYDSAYSGGVLSYMDIDSSKNFNYGFLFRPAGNKMSDLSVQLLCTDTKHQNHDFAPNINLGSDYRSSLSGDIHQIDVQPSQVNRSQFNVGVRSMYHVMLSLVDGSKTKLELDDKNHYKSLSFTSPDCVNHLGVFQSGRVVNSISVSPFIDGECLMAHDDGKVYLWNVNLNCDVNTNQSNDISGLDLVWNDDVDNSAWNQVEFGSHPRQVLFANRKQVRLLDLRGKNSPKTNFVNSSDGEIMTILGGNHFAQAQEFQYLVATSTLISLFDVRFPKQPLLEWASNLRTPCQHLAVLGSLDEGSTSRTSSVLLAASQFSQQLLMYQYSACSKPADNSCQSSVRQPPSVTAPPYSLDTFREVRRSLAQRVFRSHGHLDQRLTSPIVGVTGFDYETSRGEKMIVAMQVSGCGDLLYQPLKLSDPREVWGEENITTGLHSAAMELVRKKREASQKRADDLRLAWAATVDVNYREAIKKESLINVRCSRSKLEAFSFDHSRLANELVRNHKKKDNGECALCQPRSSNRSKPQFDDDATSTIDDPCSRCRISKEHIAAVLECRKKEIFHPANLTNDDESFFCSPDESVRKWKRPKVEPLTLVNPAPSKTHLGGVLCATWDGSYDDFWKTMRRDFEKANRKKERKRKEGLLDAASKEEIPSILAVLSDENEASNMNDNQSAVDRKLSSDMTSLLDNQPEKTAFSALLETDFSDIHFDSDGFFPVSSSQKDLPIKLPITPPAPSSSNAEPSQTDEDVFQNAIQSMIAKEKAMIFGEDVKPHISSPIISRETTPQPVHEPRKKVSLKKVKKRKHTLGF